MILSFEEFQSFVPTKPTYALFGWPLSHTMSPTLHQALFASDQYQADYIAVSVPPEKLALAFEIARQKLAGLNITIPHKQMILPLLDDIDPHAQKLGAINTVQFQNGRSIGYNTDIYGFSTTMEADQIVLQHANVLLIGYGGAATVMGYHCLQEGANLFLTGRNLSKAKEFMQDFKKMFPHHKIRICPPYRLPENLDIILNSTPCGMFPNEDELPIRFLPNTTQYVFDAIYNPPQTALLRFARSRHIRVRDGLPMLIYQAAGAQTIWTGRSFSDTFLKKILLQCYANMAIKRLHEKHQKSNIVLCGFMGSGKTTVGRKLAKLTGLSFYDLDQVIEQGEHCSISNIFQSKGEEAFRNIETKYLEKASNFKNAVIALGGGAILRDENIPLIKKNGLLLYLNPPYTRIVQNLSKSNKRPLLNQGDKIERIRTLYLSRRKRYALVADCNITATHLSALILSALRSI